MVYTIETVQVTNQKKLRGHIEQMSANECNVTQRPLLRSKVHMQILVKVAYSWT